MRPMPSMPVSARRAVLAVATIGCGAAALLTAAAPAQAATTSGAAPGTPTATAFSGTRTVGPLFSAGTTSAHGCTASVLATRTRDLVLTAAHCLRGTARGMTFAPGYNRGATPYGTWTVTAAYLPPRWISSQDPRYDYAILRVAPHGRRYLQDVTGGNVLGTAPAAGTRITAVAYNAGINDRPVRCTVPSYVTAGYPAFNCHGYLGGSSGSPWLAAGSGNATVVRGVIGGLHQGGCYEYTSYASPLRSDVYQLLARAVARSRPDTAPAPGSDGC